MKIPSVYLIGGAAVGAALLWAWSKGARGTGEALAGAAIDLVDGAVSETVYTVTDAVGIPRTSKTECQRRIEEYRAAPWYQQVYLSFGLSANCQVSDYLRYAATGKGPQEP